MAGNFWRKLCHHINHSFTEYRNVFTRPLASIVANRVGFRWLVIGAGLVSFGGLVTSVYVNSIYVLMFTFGVVTGVGFGMAFTPCAVIPATYFPDKQALVTGLALSGIGCGSCIMPFFIEFTIEQYGWRGSMMILGGLSLNLCVCGALIRPLPRNMKRIHIQQQRRDNFSSALSILSIEDFYQTKIFKSIPYLVFLLHGFLFTLGLSVMLVHITSLVEEQTHVSKFLSSAFLVGFSACNFVGRIVHGFVAHIDRVHVFSQHILAYILGSVSVLLMTLTSSYAVMLCFGCITAFMCATFGSLIPEILSEIIGHEYLTTGYGYMNLAFGLGFTGGAPFAGWLHGLSGEYRYSLYFTAVVIFLSALVMVPFSCSSLKHHTRKISKQKTAQTTFVREEQVSILELGPERCQTENCT
ncbi:monocarboxylate transporter 12-like isoform X3 [Tubulanus polymorphus]|uniref:monocarboxylate transporter 12-like isoform X3 n=1 Tax=Tubulanus polymorphus TaxID=672921 RepID=UPI003DA6467A